MDGASKVALITGAAGGIGRATAERLLRAGWKLAAADRDGDKLASLGAAEDVLRLVTDVTSMAANTEMVAQAEARFGGLDAVILNAAIHLGGGIDDVSIEALEQAMRVNFFGPVMGIKAALPALRRRGGGSVTVTASMHGLAGDSNSWAYVASKHAVVGLVKSLSRDHGWENIRINAICPGLTRQTGMTSEMEALAPETYAALARTVPLQRWAEPEEMAAVIEFLISPAASYINGLALAVDGGAHTGTGLLPPLTGA